MMADAEDQNLRRHLRAAKRAERGDQEWFRRHRNRCFRVRRAIAFEDARWGPEDHLKEPHVLVRMSPDRKEYNRNSMDGKYLPNNEAFLARLWEEVLVRRAADEDWISFTPEDHLRLLKETGLVNEG
jgi:hypothetical protein